ncbi:hypothetical protein RJ639_026895 [Escallonia herrerae]|uniref:J domain-containing protein n=1 Tax=Escallonia herrerae TaxID=1293975 RepID=A0AA89BHD6_9ASTE|nr:hypothetical protein RJ639_026895 [Escallonia herrerae]
MNEAHTNTSNGPPSRELYAMLHISPDASDEEIRKAYRQWAQVYHPDKFQSPLMKETATENFQRIREAYEILSDEYKRQIYDIYGMEGLTSGLELGPKLNRAEEIKEELERLRRQKEQEKVSVHVHPSGTILTELSLPQFLNGDGIMTGMSMASEVQSQISKRNVIAIGGNLAVNGSAGGAAASAVLRHQLSSISSIEFMASAGLRALIGFQTSRGLSQHTTATMGMAVSLRDGSINLSNSWVRTLSETTDGNIGLTLGSESSITVGWRRKEEKRSAAGEIKFGTNSFGASARYTHHFSSKSHGRIAGRVASNALELEVGGGRKISNLSSVRMLYSIGIQGCGWKFELHRGGQKLIFPDMVEDVGERAPTVEGAFNTMIGGKQGSVKLDCPCFLQGGRRPKKITCGSYEVGPYRIRRSTELPRGSYEENRYRKGGRAIVGWADAPGEDRPLASLGDMSEEKETRVRTEGENVGDEMFGFKDIKMWDWFILLLISILLSRDINAVIATGALIIPTTLYFALKAFVIKPYYLRREKQKALENMEATKAQVREARVAANKAQQLLQNVANRKRSRQLETSGLVITKAVYGNSKVLKNIDKLEENQDEIASQIMDVTIPLNFLVNDFGQLKLHAGVKKSGIMGFCDPCPGEPKQLLVEYTKDGNQYEVFISFLIVIHTFRLMSQSCLTCLTGGGR